MLGRGLSVAPEMGPAGVGLSQGDASAIVETVAGVKTSDAEVVEASAPRPGLLAMRSEGVAGSWPGLVRGVVMPGLGGVPDSSVEPGCWPSTNAGIG